MTKSIKSAIVIGATGLVGKALIELLQQNPNCEKITAIVRRESADFKHLNKVEQFVIEDFLLLNDQDVSGYSHAFSCLGSTINTASSLEIIFSFTKSTATFTAARAVLLPFLVWRMNNLPFSIVNSISCISL